MPFGERRRVKERAYVPRTVQNLRANDIVTYAGRDYIVAHKYIYEEAGVRWFSYELKDADQTIYLAVGPDPQAEGGLAIYRRQILAVEDPPPREIRFQGQSYVLTEQGEALVREERPPERAENTGFFAPQVVAYWGYTATDQTSYLSIERWGNVLEVSIGEPVTSAELDFLAGST